MIAAAYISIVRFKAARCHRKRHCIHAIPTFIPLCVPFRHVSSRQKLRRVNSNTRNLYARIDKGPKLLPQKFYENYKATDLPITTLQRIRRCQTLPPPPLSLSPSLSLRDIETAFRRYTTAFADASHVEFTYFAARVSPRLCSPGCHEGVTRCLFASRQSRATLNPVSISRKILLRNLPKMSRRKVMHAFDLSVWRDARGRGALRDYYLFVILEHSRRINRRILAHRFASEGDGRSAK